MTDPEATTAGARTPPGDASARTSPSRSPGTAGHRPPLLQLAVVALILVPGLFVPAGTRTVVIVVLVYAIFAMGYDVLLGYSDQPSLGQGLFFGLGAYAIALPLLDLRTSLWTALGLSVVVGAVVALLLGAVAIRLTAAFHVIITALFASIAHLIANTMTPVTGGSGGRPVPIPPLDLGVAELSVYDPRGTYLLVAAVAALMYLVLDRLVRSPVGQMWMAIRENPLRAANIGINVYRYRLAAFVLAGAVTAIAGALYAVTLRFASAEFFAFIWSVLPFVWVLIGGSGTLLGALVGALIFGLFQFYVAQLWTHYLIVFGVGLLVLLRWSPRGLIGLLQHRWPNLAAGSGREPG